MPGIHQVSVLSLTPCGEGVVQLSLTRPEGYEFAAGQWFRLTLETAFGQETKTFSHASAPQDPVLDMATRLSGSAFKSALEGLSVGDAVTIAGPGGRLKLPESAARIAFLTGGVGVTPVRSLLRDALARGVVFEDALVLYGNRDAECTPFLSELHAMGSSGVRVVPVYQSAPPGWQGERGLITAETVLRHLDPSDGRPVVVTGPPPMVAAMSDVLDDLGVDGPRRVVERFGV